MATILLRDGESGEIRPGDAVFDFNPREQKYQLHVAIYAGRQQSVTTSVQNLLIQGLPGQHDGELLGDSIWGLPGNYQAHFVGQRFDVDSANVKEIALISSAVVKEHNKLGTRCKWKSRMLLDPTNPILDGIPLFLQGTCGQYVEYLYESVGLDLISQAATYDPKSPYRLNPATQLYVFWAGAYSLRSNWDARYEKYPDCIFGPRSPV